MKPRYVLAAVATLLSAGAASAQYVPATYQEPYCREFTKVVTVGGQAQPAYGKACYKPDGSWEIVSDDIPTNQPVQYMPQGNYVAYQPMPQPVTYYEPAYYRAPSIWSFSFNSWSGGHSRHGHDRWNGWRDRGHGRDWGHGRGHGRHDGDGRGRGHGRH